MKEELHTEETVHTEPEATILDVSRLQVSKARFDMLLKLNSNLCLTLTIGGRVVLHYIRKNTRGTGMQGVKVARPAQFRKLAERQRTVSRAYGGILNGSEVADRIRRAFLIEEFRRFKNIDVQAEKKDKKKKKKSTKARK